MSPNPAILTWPRPAGGTPGVVTLESYSATAVGSPSASVAYPASTAAGDLIVLLAGDKPYSATPTASNFTLDGTGANGTTAPTTQAGSVRATSMHRQLTAGAPATEAVTLSGGNILLARMARLTKDTGDWAVAAYPASDSDSAGTTVYAETAGTPDVREGDYLLLAMVTPTASSTTVHSAQSLSIPGVTLGAIDWQARGTTTAGTWLSLQVGGVAVTGGSATGAAVYAATAASAGWSDCQVCITRIRAE